MLLVHSTDIDVEARNNMHLLVRRAQLLAELHPDEGACKFLLRPKLLSVNPNIKIIQCSV